MNWTEGNLARHSRGRGRQRNELLARQKQHFAKVRNGLLKGSAKQSPISISFLGSHHSRAAGHQRDSADIPHRPASSPFLVEKRRRTRVLPDSPQNQPSIREKKRRLLDKTDWVGLELQQPIDITFPGQHQAAPGSRWSKVNRPRARLVQKRREAKGSYRLEAPQPVNSRPLRIQIGSQEIQPSWGAASQPSTRRYSLAPRPLASSSLRSNTISSPVPSQARRLYATAGSGSEISQIHKGGRDEVARENRGAYLETPVKPLLPEEPTRIAFASSVIHEPAPLRANDFLVLDWSPSGSEDRGSMQVEIETPPRPIPLSQNLDQERWKRLAVGSSTRIPDESSTNSQAVIPSASSCSSALSSHIERRLLSYDVSGELGVNPSHQDLDPITSNEAQKDTQPAAREADDQLLEREQRLNQPQKAVRPVDDNSAWMKFAFDGDSDEVEEKAFAEAAHQAAAELHRFGSSTGFASAAESTAAPETDTSFGIEREIMETTSPETLSESHMTTHGTAMSESVTSNMATVGSTHVEESEPRFRFAMPRTFVGKLADSNPTAQGPPLLSHGGGKKRGRPKKKATDGRTDIRRLPDFDGDPIEEFDED
ncbi:glutamate--ammonia ligase [Hypoxylon texense]